MGSQNAEIVMYDRDGSETKNENLAIAKQISYTKPRYFLRNRQGLLIDVRQFTNIAYNDRDYPFVMVSQPAFQEYITFLKTRSGARLNIAERTKHGSY